MSAFNRPLSGCSLNLSVSDGDDTAELGFPGWQVNRVTLQIASAVFGQGVSAVFGHDWRDDGVMRAVHGLARQMQAPPAVVDGRNTGVEPFLCNVLPWPDQPSLSREDQDQLGSTLRIECAGLPSELDRFSELAIGHGPGSPTYRYLRARGLTHLRHRLNAVSSARLCVGGRRTGSAGRFPGVIEEAFLAVTGRKPLYVAGLLGGAARQIGEALEGQRMPDDFCRPTDVTRYYELPPIAESDPESSSDRQADRRSVWASFSDSGLAKLASANGLTVAENHELLHTPVLDSVIELVLTGLSRLRASKGI